MKITYINHSGFLVETENCYYVFDYYKGEMPSLDKSKEAIVFCSHFHQDPFNPKIFEILDDMGSHASHLVDDHTAGILTPVRLQLRCCPSAQNGKNNDEKEGDALQTLARNAEPVSQGCPDEGCQHRASRSRSPRPEATAKTGAYDDGQQRGPLVGKISLVIHSLNV